MSSPSPLSQSFQQAYQSLQMLPLQTKEEWAKFYVPYGQRVLNKLELLIES